MSQIPYDMFDSIKTKEEVRWAKRLESIYHKGQEKIWDGRLILDELVAMHGINLSPDKIDAIKNIFAVIFWGELAAWKISSQLATELVPLEAKLAATAQAHDEARHFYVMHDYLSLLNYKPGRLKPGASAVMENVLTANTLAKKVLGMQLMVEPVALTIFHLVREANVDSVLCNLLSYYEKDESRHVALGIQYLPKLIKEMSWAEKTGLILWQIKMLSLEVDGLKELEQDFRSLGFSPEDVFALAEKKQLDALLLLSEELGISQKVWKPIQKLINFHKRVAFSNNFFSEKFYRISLVFRHILFG